MMRTSSGGPGPNATGGAVRWTFHDPALLYLFPATYAIHALEEWVSASPILLWTVHAQGRVATPAFVAANAVGLLLMVVGIGLVRRSPRFAWIVPALATAVTLNAVGHLAGAFYAARYSAGLASAIVFWVPLGLLTLLRVWDQTSVRTLAIGCAVGLLVETVVVLLFSTLSNPF